jgi:flavin reductase (DIM6/NTAB) family NADH-FMN oxidoreductase RutF
VRPYLQPGATFAISVLGADQKRLAMVFADPFPVGPDPFPAAGAPVIDSALIGLTCEVERVNEGGDHAIVIAAVHDAVVGARGSPLVRYDRQYLGLDA